jgi:lipopolysaccharide/colanic/teichoic acid biosynthesis glycosyltransferase
MTRKYRFTILIFDLAWIVVAFFFAYALRYHRLSLSLESETSFRIFYSIIGAALLTWTLLSLSRSLDGFQGGWQFSAIVSHLTIGIFYLMVFLFAVGFATRHYYSRLLFLYLPFLLLGGFLLLRCGVRLMILSRARAGKARRAVILGEGTLATELAEKISRHPELLLNVVGFLYPSGNGAAKEMPADSTINSSLPSTRIAGFLEKMYVQDVIVVLQQSGSVEVEKVVSQCRQLGMRVRLVPHWYQLYVSDANIVEIDGVPLISLEERNIWPGSLVVKRMLDAVAGSVLLVLSLPLLVVAAWRIRSHRRNVLCKEIRCGRMGERFSMYRLNINRDDPTLGGLERFMAKFSLTELPQLWNVLAGHMSLVGPRPESPERVKHYSDWQRQRLSVEPGLTGLAQVQGLREQHSSEEKARFDLQYIFHWSLFLDLSLILQTGWTLALRLIRPVREPAAIAAIGAEMAPRRTAYREEGVHADRAESSAD